MQPALSVQGLTKLYQTSPDSPVITALQDISFTIEAGEFVALVGPSGCGKSTLLNIIGLTDAPSSGSVRLLDTDIPFTEESLLTMLRRTKIGQVFQYFYLLPTLSALENVVLMGLLSGMSRATSYEKATTLITHVGLADRLHNLPHQLSGGQMQRVALCRALIHAPAIVLADEPTGNLDSVSGKGVLEMLQEIARSGTAVVMATHSDASRAYVSRTIQIADGRILVDSKGSAQ